MSGLFKFGFTRASKVTEAGSIELGARSKTSSTSSSGDVDSTVERDQNDTAQATDEPTKIVCEQGDHILLLMDHIGTVILTVIVTNFIHFGHESPLIESKLYFTSFHIILATTFFILTTKFFCWWSTWTTTF